MKVCEVCLIFLTDEHDLYSPHPRTIERLLASVKDQCYFCRGLWMSFSSGVQQELQDRSRSYVGGCLVTGYCSNKIVRPSDGWPTWTWSFQLSITPLEHSHSRDEAFKSAYVDGIPRLRWHLVPQSGKPAYMLVNAWYSNDRLAR